MKKILGITILALVIGLGGCGGPVKIKLFVDDELFATYEESVMEMLPLDIPEKDGMMFIGWQNSSRNVYDLIEVGGSMELHATWEDPSVVFGFNEDPMIHYEGKHITSYTGEAEHIKIPTYIDGELLNGISGELFTGTDVRTVILPMDAQVNGSPFKDSEVERVEFYGEYNLTKFAMLSMFEFDEILVEYADECIVVDGGTDASWEYAQGCPIVEMIRKTDSIFVNDVEYYSYEVMVDINIYPIGSINQLGTSAFKGAVKLKIVEIPFAMAMFFQDMFEDCSELETVIIDERHKFLSVNEGIIYSDDGTHLYFYPPGLKGDTFEITDEITSLHSSAFIATTYLKTLIIPETFNENIDIYGASSLEEIVVADGNEKFRSIDGVLFEDGELIKYPASKDDTTYMIPEGTTSIRTCAFMNNKHLEEIIFNSSITEIGRNAFWKAESLTRLDIPSNILTIHLGLIHDSTITTIIIRRDVPVDGDITQMFYTLYGDSDVDRIIYVPDSSLEDYRNDEHWSNHYDDIKPISEIE